MNSASRKRKEILEDVAQPPEDVDVTDRDTKQVGIGTKINVFVNMPVFIFATLWPSWLTAAEALSFKEITVYVEDTAGTTRKLMEKGSKGHYMLAAKAGWQKAVLGALNGRNNVQCLMLIQGAESTVLKICRWLESNASSERGKAWVVAGFTDGVTKRQRSLKDVFIDKVSSGSGYARRCTLIKLFRSRKSYGESYEMACQYGIGGGIYRVTGKAKNGHKKKGKKQSCRTRWTKLSLGVISQEDM